MRSISGSTTFSKSSSDEQLAHGADRMELEAAEALAGLAQFATRESSESGTNKWGGKGKRARPVCQVKSESPLVDSLDLALNSSNYKVTMEYDQAAETDIHDGFKKAKIKQRAKLLSPSLTCEASATAFGDNRSRKNLTEAEKDEKRLRRVLANRESARQTIRRRQALHEELSRKASDLSMENFDLMREKELALEKLQSLKYANQLLKTQMCQTVNLVKEENFLQMVQNPKSKVEENLLQMSLNIESDIDENLDLKLANPNISSPKNTSKVYRTNSSVEHSQLTPCLLPPIIQPLSSDKSSPMPYIPLCASAVNSSDPKPYTINPPPALVYILSYPWFLPVPYHHNGGIPLHLSAAENDKYYTKDVSLTSGNVEDHLSTFTTHAKAGVSDSMENGPVDFGDHATGILQIMSPHNLSTGKLEPWIGKDSSQLGTQSLCSASQMNKEPALFFPIKITEHAVAAAEARKRRKELTKFKNFTGRQYRLPC